VTEDGVPKPPEQSLGHGFAFVRPGEMDRRVTPLVARRITACLDALAAGTVASLEDGSIPDATVSTC
jgi:hypothetical protein